MSKTPTGHTTPTAGSVRTGAWVLVATLIVRWYTHHVDHLTMQEKALAVVAVAGVINQVVTLIENRYGKGLLREPSGERCRRRRGSSSAWSPSWSS
jgi:hypothetical protein